MKSVLNRGLRFVEGYPDKLTNGTDVYFSADIETDGPIPGPYSILSFALVYAGAYDGDTFYVPPTYNQHFYRELKPISEDFEQEALNVNGLNRQKLITDGLAPETAMTDAARWVENVSKGGNAVFVAYPLSFDWSWMYWYFMRFSNLKSPFGYSRCFDIKTAISLKLGRTVSAAGREKLPEVLRAKSKHTHHALDDAIEQAEIFIKVMELDADHE